MHTLSGYRKYIYKNYYKTNAFSRLILIINHFKYTNIQRNGRIL